MVFLHQSKIIKKLKIKKKIIKIKKKIKILFKIYKKGF